ERFPRGINQFAPGQGAHLRADPWPDEEDLKHHGPGRRARSAVPGGPGRLRRREIRPAGPALARGDADLRPALQEPTHLRGVLRHAFDPAQAELAAREATEAARRSERE